MGVAPPYVRYGHCRVRLWIRWLRVRAPSGTPKVTLVERSQVEIEQFLAMLRFENRKKLEEMHDFQK